MANLASNFAGLFMNNQMNEQRNQQALAQQTQFQPGYVYFSDSATVRWGISWEDDINNKAESFFQDSMLKIHDYNSKMEMLPKELLLSAHRLEGEIKTKRIEQFLK